MNEFFKKLMTRISTLWTGWSMQQRVIVGVIGIVVIAVVIALFQVSSTPVMVSVFTVPIRDMDALDRIAFRLDQENVNFNISANGIVQVADDVTARRVRGILTREDLIPSGIDPWAVFDRERWTITDFERNVNFQRAQERMITEHIRAIDDVDNVDLRIVWPERVLFAADQKPTTASVIITPKPGSDIIQNRKKIEGIQKLLQFAIEGIQLENIAITDNYGNLLNDFEGMAAFDRLSNIERESKMVLNLETRYRGLVLGALQQTFGQNRVRDLNIKIDMDMSQKSIATTQVLPTTIRPRTPELPYDDSIVVESVIRGETVSDTVFRGQGFNPEGPPGIEGNVMPAFRDMDNYFGEMNQSSRVTNYALSEQEIQEEKSPQIDRITVAVNIDGVWRKVYDARGNPVVLSDGSIEREYTPIPEEDLRRTETLIRNAIGYNSARGDSVSVTNIPFDRTEEFRLEDAAYFRQKQIQNTIIIFVSGLTLLLFGFMLFRVVSREMERRKRFAEEERARREQMLRESAMADAESEGAELSISFEERSRMELMENAINMAKEHSEDAAQLIRTWLMEE